MISATDPNKLVAGFAIGGLALAGLWRLIAWVRDAPVTPDPWDAETDQKLSEPEAVSVCHHCFTPQPDTAWFCERCGCAVGRYNNWMPFVYIFSTGEVLRNGVTSRMRAGPLIVIGYLLYAIGNYFLFAPVYLLYFFKHLKQPEEIKLPPQDTE